jgi:small-conductance mechanosensitive channel
MNWLTQQWSQLNMAWFFLPTSQWIVASIAFVVLFLLLLWGRNNLAKSLNTVNLPNTLGVQRFVVKALETVSPLFLLLISLIVATRFLHLPKTLHTILNELPLIALLFQIGAWTKPLTLVSLQAHIDAQKTENDKLAYKSLMGPVSVIIVAIVWIILLLVALDNFNVNITGLVTGLGIGGIVIALAVKSILEDLFSAFTIMLDKPFVVGDFIALGEYMGTVEHIGLKTTKINALSGEQLIISNADLLSSRIRNYRRMEERRVVQHVQLDFSTSLEQLKNVPIWIEALVRKQQHDLRFDRVHFTGVGTIGLALELVYFVKNSDYNLHMDYQQTFFLALLKKLQAEGIMLAQQNLNLLKTQLTKAEITKPE